MENCKFMTYLCKSNLKERGWTDSLIKRFLGKHDKAKKNPHYASAAPMLLYLTERVEQAEASEVVKAEMVRLASGRKGRQEAARKAVETKRARTEALLDRIAVKLRKTATTTLIKNACHSYNAMQVAKGCLENHADERSDPEFLARIVVNYIRHELTYYDHHLANLVGKVGTGDACLDLKDKVLDAIAETYPEFAGECSKQSRLAREAAFQEEIR